MSFKTTVLHELEDGEKVAMGPSDDGTVFSVAGGKLVCAVRVSDKTKQFVITQDGKGPDADKIDLLELDPSGTRLMYVAKKDKKRRLFLDGKPGPEHSDFNGVAFSADGSRHVYVARDKKEYRVFLDGKESPPHTYIGSLEMSPDGSRHGYLANDGGVEQKYNPIEGGRWTVVIDGETQPGDFDNSIALKLGPGNRVAYAMRVSDSAARVVADGKAHRDFGSVSYTMRYSAAGILGYEASDRDGGKSYLMIDGAIACEGKQILGPIYSDDGKRWGAIVDEVDLWIDGKKLASGTKKIASAGFSPDGKRVAWVDETKSRRWIVVDGKKGPEHTTELQTDHWFKFSPDGQHIAYIGNMDRKVFVFHDDEVLGKGYRNMGFAYAFSPDSKRFGFNVLDEEDYRWIIDGKPCKLTNDYETNGHGLHFSPDSKRWASIGGKKGKLRIVIDDEEVGPALRKVHGMAWLPTGKLVVLGRDKSKMMILEEE
jgi:hypothetical protein